ncbi:MAG: hypothetical protein JWM21_4501 [Acidobacteria bacterium]|nr:hypothetical protein [Acidobacteriota bacterium]
MGGCVLRAWGDDFQPELFLAGSSLEPCNVFTKGARKSESRAWDTSGLTVLVSDDSDNFKHQVNDAIEFQTSNRLEIRRLKSSLGIDGLSLDFGVNRKNGFLQSQLFPAELVSLAAKYSMALEVSIYEA